MQNVYKNRLDKLKTLLKSKNIEGILVNKPENRFYLSGFSGDTGYLFIAQDKQYILVDPRFTEQAKIQTSFEVIEFKSSFMGTLKEIIENLHFENIAIEEDYINVSLYNKVKSVLNINLSFAEGIIDELRMFKDETELDNIRTAVKISEEAFVQVLELVKPGVKERDLAIELEYLFKKKGASGVSFPPIVAAGVRTSLPHAEPTENAIKFGDFVLFDFGCIYNGYCSDMTRTLVVGEVNEEQKKIYNFVKEAQKRAFEFIANTKKCSDVDKVVIDYFKEVGYADKFIHSLGHGVGLYIHEEPRLSFNYEKELKPGMVVTIEPGLYLEGFGGVRIEDMVIINDNNVENLMTFTRDLILL